MRKPFERAVGDDTMSLVEACRQPKSGQHRFFRASGTAMQARFAELVDHTQIPRLLIHGNPHVANYCKTRRGTAMVDFDRSRVGPYAYDIVRFLISVSLCRDQQDDALLHPIILDHFRRGYLYGSGSKGHGFEEMQRLRVTEAKRWQSSTKAYVEEGKKWARRLERHAVSPRKRHAHLLRDYLANRGESKLLKRFDVARIAEVPGSMGKLHYVFLLEDRKDRRDSLLLDIKETYVEVDTQWYQNPFDHQGVRMNAASDIYAPGWEQRPGHATWKGQDYWGRQIPLQQVKPVAPLRELDQCDLCYSVGSQLGWGHARGAAKGQKAAILADFGSRWDEYVDAARQMRVEVIAAHAAYLSDIEAMGADLLTA